MKRAAVTLESGHAKVTYDDTKQTPAKLASTIDMLGFKASVVSVADAPRSDAVPRR